MTTEDEVITRLRAARDAMLADAPAFPPTMSTPAPLVEAVRDIRRDVPARRHRERTRFAAAVSAAAAVVLLGVGLSAVLDRPSALTHRPAQHRGATGTAAPYMYAKTVKIVDANETRTLQTWFPVSGVGRYVTKVTLTGSSGWARKHTPDGVGVFVYRSTCKSPDASLNKPDPAVKIPHAPYSRLGCPIGPKTHRSRPERRSLRADWAFPTTYLLPGLSRDPKVLTRKVRSLALSGYSKTYHPTQQEISYGELDIVHQLLTVGGYVPHAVSVALKDTVAAIPGLRVRQHVTVLGGRTGTEYYLPVSDGSQDGRLVFAADSVFVGEAPDTVTDPPWPQYASTSYAAGTARTLGGRPTLNH